MAVAISDDLSGSIPHKSSNRVRLLRDCILVVGATLVAAWLCARFDVSEALFSKTRDYEGLQFDELPVILLVLAVGFIWFAMRRYNDAGELLKRQHLTEERLRATLLANRQLAQQYLNVQELERKNLARELHDELGQYINAIKVDAIAVRDAAPLNEPALHEASSAITKSIDHVYMVVSDLIRRLRPVGLDDLGLLAAIEHCIEEWRRRLPTMSISLSTQGNLADLSEATNLTLYRLTQESLTNAAKHSRASQVTIELRRSDATGEVVLRIADNGVGVRLDQPRRGFGLVSMRERVEMQGGNFEIQSEPGNGFSLQTQLPG